METLPLTDTATVPVEPWEGCGLWLLHLLGISSYTIDSRYLDLSYLK